MTRLLLVASPIEGSHRRWQGPHSAGNCVAASYDYLDEAEDPVMACFISDLNPYSMILRPPSACQYGLGPCRVGGPEIAESRGRLLERGQLSKSTELATELLTFTERIARLREVALGSTVEERVITSDHIATLKVGQKAISARHGPCQLVWLGDVQVAVQYRLPRLTVQHEKTKKRGDDELKTEMIGGKCAVEGLAGSSTYPFEAPL
ncbi:hypothetical protein NEOLEDRAFT_1182435 [Neolentinus lepideus HHB14362 ss-1]|uniref:Uncharacterized protein n=1 Tax=Neolentinus lepideus HHB14362 ss-1 TaxID=1314782 RepID=A0A165P6B2_9AGAM|nr:hypothetical protein NEOLEDRAFT_1182435 [Neolentinus lepideus HHB14362 ss-1]